MRRDAKGPENLTFFDKDQHTLSRLGRHAVGTSRKHATHKRPADPPRLFL